MPMPTVDLNTDIGEGFGAWRIADDAALLGIVTSANVACGLHAGDPDIMEATFRTAKHNGVAVGAHPGYADLPGFGRRIIPHTIAEIERLVAYQIGAAMALSTYAGHPITYVKAHAALGNQTQTDPDIAAAVTRAIKAVDPNLVCLTIARGHQERIARDMGMQTRSEIYADRAYTPEGHLVSRKRPDAIIHDPLEAAARAVRMVQNGAIETIDGTHLPTPVQSICVHSDTPAAVAIAAGVRHALQTVGIQLKAF